MKVTNTDVKAEMKRRREQGFKNLYPDTGKYARSEYPKHMEFFAAGKYYSERAAIAGNRVGKSYGIGGYEVALHATGLYPDWWDGRRFSKPVSVIAAGDTHQSTRDIVQAILLGPYNAMGEGLIPKDCIAGVTRKNGVPEAYERIQVKHVSGGESTISLMAYAQGREQFQGVKAGVVWFDEESKRSIWEEAMMRTMTEDGIGILTYTPLSGWSSLVDCFLGADRADTRWVIGIGWDDVPHLSKDQKAKMLASCEPHLVASRSRGIPDVGSGAIYPIGDEAIKVEDFKLPEHWPRFYGMDVGWNWTAAVHMAWDRETDTVYVYRCYKAGKSDPAVHAQAIKAPGEWIRGACDYAGTNQTDGKRVIDVYRDLGLKLINADKSVESGLYKVWTRLSEGTLKVFASCGSWFDEKGKYRRDDNGKVVKENDHLMDSMRYGLMKMAELATYAQNVNILRERKYIDFIPNSMSWMA